MATPPRKKTRKVKRESKVGQKGDEWLKNSNSTHSKSKAIIISDNSDGGEEMMVD